MRKLLYTLLVLVIASVVVIPQVLLAASILYPDIKGHWAIKDIEVASGKGYVSGYPNGSFKPNGTITRAEAAGMLSRVTKLQPGQTSSAFSDLDNHWSKDQVRKLVDLGFINPSDYSDGFKPDSLATRYEIMKWIAMGLAKSEPDFAQALIDTKKTLLPTPESFNGGIKEHQIPYIAVVKGTGIIEGFEDLTFRPATNTTRAEVTSIILRYEKVEGTQASSYRSLNELREVGLTGTNMFSITNFKYKYFGDKHTEFTGIQGKPITGRKGLATIAIHKMLFIPLEGSVYFDMFISPSTKEGMETWEGEMIQVVNEVSFTSNVDGLDTRRYIQEYSGGLVANYGISDSFAEERGYNSNVKVYPTSALDVEFIKKDETIRAWFQSGVKKNSFNSITTDDMYRMYITDQD